VKSMKEGTSRRKSVCFYKLSHAKNIKGLLCCALKWAGRDSASIKTTCSDDKKTLNNGET
jgi:hypothetical protein